MTHTYTYIYLCVYCIECVVCFLLVRCWNFSFFIFTSKIWKNLKLSCMNIDDHMNSARLSRCLHVFISAASSHHNNNKNSNKHIQTFLWHWLTNESCVSPHNLVKQIRLNHNYFTIVINLILNFSIRVSLHIFFSFSGSCLCCRWDGMRWAEMKWVEKQNRKMFGKLQAWSCHKQWCSIEFFYIFMIFLIHTHVYV